MREAKAERSRVRAAILALSYLGNVVDWSKTPRAEYGSVGLLIIDNPSIAARSSSATCGADKPCWLLGLRLRVNSNASYGNSPLTPKARILLKQSEGGI
jgi:hypothetical protein